MKINWGTGVLLAFIGFISFILFFVIRMGTDPRANHELVTEEYYKAELGYQKEIDAENNANDHNKQIQIEKTDEGLLLTFPVNLDPQHITGTVSLYRPSNKRLDVDLPIHLSDVRLLIPNKGLVEGRWDITVFWEYQNEKYLHKESITY